MGTKGYKNALLSAFIVASLLTSTALPILGWTSLASDSSEAQIWMEDDNSTSTTSDGKAKLQGFDKAAGKWTSGSLAGWKELDWVPYRLKFRDLPEGTSAHTVKVYHNNLLDDKDGVDRLRDFRVGDEDGNPVDGTVVVEGPFYKTPGKGCDRDIYYALLVSFTTPSPKLNWYLYWQAHLAFGASVWPGASLHAYTDISGKQDVPINVPPVPPGSISGSKWNDLNHNGAWDLDEPGLSGWTIQLYFFDPVESAWAHLADENTDVAGGYTFSGLIGGDYYLAEILQDNWIQTYPPAGIHSVTLSEGENRSSLDFGNFLVPTVTTNAATGVTTTQATMNADFTVGYYDNVDVWFQYRVQGEDAWIETTPTTYTTSGSHSDDATGLSPDTTYEFRARLQYDTENIYGDALTFTTEAVALSAPTLKSPADGTITNDNTPTFEWTVGLNADNHQLLVDNDPDFTSPIENRLFGSTDNTYTPVLENSLPDDNYSWKVIAINALGENQSSVWTFVIDTVPPAAPSLVPPADGTITDNSTPTFGWSDVTGAENYDLLVDNDADFSSPEI